jgi:hypothetical protein
MSEIKVNKISPRTNCGTVTLGDSGDSFVIPSGATITNNGTQTGFGREGSVNWQTSIKTATFTAASGEGYFCNTSGGAFTVNLPSSPSVGDIVAIKDYGSSFGTNNLTIGRGGSNMNGSASDSVRSTDNESLTLVYADATKGWLAVEEGTGFVGETFITASGGTITCCGDYKIHTFTGPGTFTVCSLSSSPAENIVSYMVVAGGGGAGSAPGPGSSDAAGGGGAGGFREFKNTSDPYSASPLNGNPGGTAITVTATAFPITVGGGGAGGPGANAAGAKGADSVFSTITSTGGGRGRNNGGPGNRQGGPGGSGGGPSGGGSGVSGGVGNDPSTTPAQGNPGSPHSGSPDVYGGGGGGAGGAAADSPNGNPAADGGVAVTSSINGTATTYAGGGGGGGSPAGPGGQGGDNPSGPARGGGGPGGNAGGGGNPGSDNTGGGGGGAGGLGGTPGGNGGSGVVIIRYKFQ